MFDEKKINQSLTDYCKSYFLRFHDGVMILLNKQRQMKLLFWNQPVTEKKIFPFDAL